MITKKRAEEISKIYYDKALSYCMVVSKNNYEEFTLKSQMYVACC